MIDVHQRMIEVTNSLPAIGITDSNPAGFKPHYDWGDLDHLNKLIKLYNNNQETPYPLIYNVSNFTNQNSKRNRIENYRLSLVLATRNTELEGTNSQRWASSYKNILFPLAGYLEQMFKKSQIFVWGGEFRLYEFPNYGSDGENETTDIWDALRFDTEISVNDFCLNNFTYKTINT